MSIYRIIGISSGAGYKVDVTSGSSGLRVIGIFPTKADATNWIAADQNFSLTALPNRPNNEAIPG